MEEMNKYVNANEEHQCSDSTAEGMSNKSSKQSAWSTPFIVITVLLFIILILMMAVLGLMVHVTQTLAKDTAYATVSSSFKEWAIYSNVTGNLPGFNSVSQNTQQAFQSYPNFTELNNQILRTKRDVTSRPNNIVNTLSNIQDTSASTAGVADDILLVALKLLVLHHGSITSCNELKSQYPSSPSGYYTLASANGSTLYTTYCNMEELCGSGGGWTRLAYLDMTDSKQNCPPGFKLYQSGGVRACGRDSSRGGCVSVQFPSNGISYSQICGRVTGYQYGHTDSLH